jgi:methionyl-tRNA formyltransferase
VAVPTLDALVHAGYEIPVVVTRADARRGRNAAPQASPVKAAAQRHGLQVSHDHTVLLDVDVDLGVVVAYGRIIPTPVLERVPMVNLHFSLLPRWRGAAPVERALLAGDDRTGVCVMDVVDGLDEGDVYACEEIPIPPDATLGSLRDRLVTIGTELVLDGLANGFGPAAPQVGETRYAEKLTMEDRRLDFTAGASSLRRVVALGGAWTTFRGHRLKVWEVRTTPAEVADRPPGLLVAPGDGREFPQAVAGGGWIELVEVQPEGKPRMDGRSWANGARLAPEDRLGA